MVLYWPSMCEALNLILIPARKKKKKERHQNPNKQKTPEHYRIFKPQTGNWGSAPCFAEWMSRLRCFCIYKVKRSDVAQQGSKLQNTRHGGALFVDKICLRFNLLQLYRSVLLAQIRCTELVAGRGWKHTCLTTPSRLYSGLGASKGVIWNSLIHVATLALWFVKGRFIVTFERKQVAIFLSKPQKGPLTVQFTSN